LTHDPPLKSFFIKVYNNLKKKGTKHPFLKKPKPNIIPKIITQKKLNLQKIIIILWLDYFI